MDSQVSAGEYSGWAAVGVHHVEQEIIRSAESHQRPEVVYHLDPNASPDSYGQVEQQVVMSPITSDEEDATHSIINEDIISRLKPLLESPPTRGSPTRVDQDSE